MRYASVADLPTQHRAHAEAQLRGEPLKPLFGVSASTAAAALRTLATKINDDARNKLRGAANPKRTKYGNVRVFLEGQWWDSQLEYDCYCQLVLRKAAGEIAYIKRQVTFVLEGGVRYRADFECVLTLAYATKVGACSEVWDAKGKDTQASKNKRKQVAARYGVDVRIWTKADR